MFERFLINPNWGSARSGKPASRVHQLPSRREAERKKRLKLRPMIERVEGVRLQLCESDRTMCDPVTSDPVQVACDRPAAIRSGQGAFFCLDCGGGWNADSIKDAGGLFDMVSGQPIAPKVAPVKPPEIVFTPGAFQSFIATRTFELGVLGMKVIKGSDLQFDGSFMRYSGGQCACPALRAAVQTGWIVLTAKPEEWCPPGWKRESSQEIWRHRSGILVTREGQGFYIERADGRGGRLWRPDSALVFACAAALGILFEDASGIGADWQAYKDGRVIAHDRLPESCARAALEAYEQFCVGDLV